MRSFLPFIIIGISTGSVYAIAALGLVLTYKTSGVFNFAHGALAAVGAAVFYELRQNLHVPWPVAALVALALVGVIGGLLLEMLARTLAGGSTATRIVATVGLLLLLQGILTLRLGTTVHRFNAFLPTRAVHLPGVKVGIDQLIVIACGVALLVALTAFFRVTRVGVATRAVVENADLLGLGGTDPVRVRRTAWVIGNCFATVSGLFLATSIGLDATLLTLLVVQAFGAAAVGAFSSMAMTYVGGLLIGVGSSLMTRYLVQLPALQGLPPSLPFIVLLLVMVLFPRRLPDVSAAGRVWGSVVASAGRIPGRLQFVGVAVLAAVFATVPAFAGVKTLLFSNGLVTAMELLSLALLVRLSGQVSLCQIGFAAVGAAAFAHLSSAGVPWLAAVLLAGLVAVPVGALVAIPAIRLSGVYLAIATFGFGILLERLVYPMALMFGRTSIGVVTPRPHFAGLDTDAGYFWLVLAFAIGACLLVMLIARSRLGRLLRGLADSPTALSTNGANINITLVVVFCVSAFIAAVAGALSGPVVGRTAGGNFASLTSLVLLAVLLIFGRGLVLPAFVAAAALVLPSYAQRVHFLGNWEPMAFGIGALLIGLSAASTGRPAFADALFEKADRRRRSPVAARGMADGDGRRPAGSEDHAVLVGETVA